MVVMSFSQSHRGTARHCKTLKARDRQTRERGHRTVIARSLSPGQTRGEAREARDPRETECAVAAIPTRLHACPAPIQLDGILTPN